MLKQAQQRISRLEFDIKLCNARSGLEKKQNDNSADMDLHEATRSRAQFSALQCPAETLDKPTQGPRLQHESPFMTFASVELFIDLEHQVAKQDLLALNV